MKRYEVKEKSIKSRILATLLTAAVIGAGPQAAFAEAETAEATEASSAEAEAVEAAETEAAETEAEPAEAAAAEAAAAETTAEETAAEGSRDAAASMLEDPEINKLIDENIVEVRENGYAELLIPESLHHVSKDWLSPRAAEVADVLIENGYQAYISGGAVRDLILGEEANDFDIVTDATMEEQMGLFGDQYTTHGASGTDVQFGVVHFDDEAVDIVQFVNIPAEYSGLEYLPEYDPEALYADSAMMDSFRRDLTINSLYYDVTTGDILDWHGGINDLREGIIRTTVDPKAQLDYRPGNLLRFLRFKARFDFALDEELEALLKEHAAEYAKEFDPNELDNQLNKMWDSSEVVECMEALYEYGLFPLCYPPVADYCESDEYKERLFDEVNRIDELLPVDMRKCYRITPLILLPAVEKAMEDEGLSAQDAVTKVLDEEATVYGYFGDERELVEENLLTLTGAQAESEDGKIIPFPGTEEKTQRFSFFENDELNAMIDENYEQVKENGWAELRVPRELHGITEDLFSPNALDAAHKLIDAGYDAYIVGGAIRDLIMGTDTMDFDITTTASNDEIVEVLGDVSFHSIPSGHSFGLAHYPDEDIDVASCVNIPKAYYGLPGVPEFDVNELYSDNYVSDSFQRDFTMNAIYYDVASGDLVDYHGGMHDIREGIINTNKPPRVNIVEDPRIIIRGIRFMSRYDFKFGEELENTMRDMAPAHVRDNDPNINYSNMSKYYNAGYARTCYDNLMNYGVFQMIYGPVAGRCNTEEYKTYITAAMNWMDERYAEGEEIDADLGMIAILWPVIENIDTDQYEQIYDVQSETVTISVDETRPKYTAVYDLEKKLADEYTEEEAMEIAALDEFDIACDLLMIRAETDESLKDAAEFWAGIQEEAIEEAA